MDSGELPHALHTKLLERQDIYVMLRTMLKRPDDPEDPNVRALAASLHAQSLGNAQQCRLVRQQSRYTAANSIILTHAHLSFYVIFIRIDLYGLTGAVAAGSGPILMLETIVRPTRHSLTGKVCWQVALQLKCGKPFLQRPP